MRQTTPPNVSSAGATIRASREDPRPELAHHPIGGARRLKRRKEIGDGGADLVVGIQDGVPVLVIDVADGKGTAQVPAPRRRPLRLLQAASEDVKFCFGHGPLQSEAELHVLAGRLKESK